VIGGLLLNLFGANFHPCKRQSKRNSFLDGAKN
jgi:hypothetical protein